jgi:Uma2 family endonuclease
MSTTTPARPPTRPPRDWIPKPLARLTVDQYEAMVDSGVFTKRDRFQLINGLLVTKVSKSPRHVLAARNVRDELQALIPPGWDLRIEDPVRLPPGSEPEPDISVARGDKKDYATRHPEPADLALVVEVAESSLSEDRKLASVYGAAGIPVYWIVNLKARQVELYTVKHRRGYGRARVFKTGQSIPVMIDGATVGRIAVADILPPVEPPTVANGA